MSYQTRTNNRWRAALLSLLALVMPALSVAADNPVAVAADEALRLVHPALQARQSNPALRATRAPDSRAARVRAQRLQSLLRGPAQQRAAGPVSRGASAQCGDGLPGAGEQCDDGNLSDGDGCAADCQIEMPFDCTAADGSSTIGDGGFEFGGILTSGVPNPFWTEAATDNDFDGFSFTPICNSAACLGDPQADGLFQGTHWAWFGGGVGAPGGLAEVTSISQSTVIAAADTTLAFWVQRTACESGLTDALQVSIDTNVVLTVVCDEVDADFMYYSIDLSSNSVGGPYNDDNSHDILFEATTRVGLDGTITNIFADFITLGTPLAQPSICANNCGNGSPDGSEQCDDGNTDSLDGCSDMCEVEAGYECSAAVAPMPQDAIADGSFELGGISTSGQANPFWAEAAGGAFEPICNADGCGASVPNTGTHFTWFGGVQDSMGVSNNQSVTQTVTLPAGATTLSFSALRGLCAPVMPEDKVEILLDGNVVDTLTCDQQEVQYVEYSIDLVTAAGGPYNDGGAHTLQILGTTTGIDLDGAGDLQLDWTNVFIDDVSALTGVTDPAQPSVCVLRETCFEEDFDPGVAGDLAQLGWVSFNTGSVSVDWGTTDDGICLSGLGSPNAASNLTSGSGEAACVDSDVVGPGLVEAYMCTPLIDYSEAINPQFEVKVNYQNFDSTSEDLFEILVGTAAPDAGSIAGYQSAFASTTNLGGFIGPGAAISTLPAPASAHWCYRYRGNFDWWAQIDDMQIRADSCSAPLLDTDEDGVEDALDNCVDLPNADQRDSDADGLGNMCDGDFDQDCLVNFSDLSLQKAVFFMNGDLAEDMTGDETVNFEDLSALKAEFFKDYTAANPSGIAGNLCEAGR